MVDGVSTSTYGVQYIHTSFGQNLRVFGGNRRVEGEKRSEKKTPYASNRLGIRLRRPLFLGRRYFTCTLLITTHYPLPTTHLRNLGVWDQTRRDPSPSFIGLRCVCVCVCVCMYCTGTCHYTADLPVRMVPVTRSLSPGFAPPPTNHCT